MFGDKAWKILEQARVAWVADRVRLGATLSVTMFGSKTVSVGA